MAKRALKWPQHFSTTAALVSLGMETMKSSKCNGEYNNQEFMLQVQEDGVIVLGNVFAIWLRDDDGLSATVADDDVSG